MALGHIHKGATVGTEHPFVGREDHEVRIEPLHIEIKHADVVRGVDQK